ncbi:hypothetical protein [Roseisolibacter agri]|uniref:DUF3108 domain-containing protein n=1 Tax=Roseisolibacter agri TaxID=2014610 RepID=A0AA37QEZ7_9BACT|nr:hypothetical protein [Roseisolibacter agri]GLC25140.1 hypothetical protein rosag_16530 [Roseisolibacter agri]
MRHLPLLAVLAPGVLHAQPAQQPDTIRVGHPSVAHALAAGVDSTDTYFVAPSGERRLGVVYEERVVPVSGGFLVVQRNARPDGRLLSLDSVAVDGRTLATRWHSDLTPRGSRRVTFANGRMAGTATDSAGTVTPVDLPAPSDAIDYSLGSRLVPHLPLREGYVATLALHDVTRGPQWTTVRVLGREDVAVKGATVSAWKVALEYGTFSATQWIDPTAKRMLRTQVERGTTRMVAERR